MSTIGVRFHNEDIHNIIHKSAPPVVQSPRYKSKKKFLNKNELSKKSGYNGHQTFGLPHYEPPESWNYLKKGKPHVAPPPAKVIDKKEFKCTIGCKSSPLPKCSFENRNRSHKNFVKENIKKIGAIKIKLPPPRKVETPRGTVREMAHLLQMIKIRESEEYGKIPKYLCERRKLWAAQEEKNRMEQNAVREYKEKMGIGTMGMSENVYMVDKETRQKLLDGLKENWNELSKQFLKLPVMIDSWPKIKRKMILEQKMDQIEKDIRLVESHPYIYLERQDKRSFEKIISDEIKLKEEMEIQKKESEKKEEETEEKIEEKTEEVEDKSQVELSEKQMEQSDEKKEEEEKVLNY